MDERKKLIDALTQNDIRYSLQMLISLYTGMRMGEVNALKVSDVNFTFRHISISRTVSADENGKAIFSETTKTNAGKRTIPMTDDIEIVLRAAIGEKKSGYIFTRDNDMPIPTSAVKKPVFPIEKKI